MVTIMQSFVQKFLMKAHDEEKKVLLTKALMLLTLSMRYYNRVSTLVPLAKGWMRFDLKKGVPFGALAAELSNHEEALYKPHARPPQPQLKRRPAAASAFKGTASGTSLTMPIIMDIIDEEHWDVIRPKYFEL